LAAGFCIDAIVADAADVLNGAHGFFESLGTL
jgi:hypothetical protein